MGGGEKKSDKQEVETDNEAAYENDHDDDEEQSSNLQLGPQCTLKAQIEKDKDDESLRRWKEQLLGAVDFESVGVPRR